MVAYILHTHSHVHTEATPPATAHTLPLNPEHHPSPPLTPCGSLSQNKPQPLHKNHAQVCLLANTTSKDAAPGCSDRIDWRTDSGLGNCAAADYGATGSKGLCQRTIQLQLVHGDACSLSHTITVSDVGVYCSLQYPKADCPLGPDPGKNMDSTSSLQFTVSADKFCSGDRAMVINNAVTIHNWVTQKALNRSAVDATDRAVQLGDTVYFLLSIDTAKSLAVYAVRPVAFQTKLGVGGTYTQPQQARLRLAEKYDDSGNALGFDYDTQTHAMRARIDPMFVQDTDGNALLGTPQSASPTTPVFAQLIFDCDYDSSQSRRRRRRRQAVAGVQREQGQAAVGAYMNLVPGGGSGLPQDAATAQANTGSALLNSLCAAWLVSLGLAVSVLTAL